MTGYIAAFRLFNRNLRFFLLSSALHGFAFFGIYSLLLNLYLLRLGYDSRTIGLVNGIGPLAMAVGSLPAGRISQRIGSRQALFIGYLMIMLGLGAVPLNEMLPPDWREGWIVGTYAVAWLFGSVLIVNFAPFLMGATTPEERDHAFAMQAALIPVAGFAGNLLGGILPSAFVYILHLSSAEAAAPYRYSLLLAAALYVLSALAIWQTRDVRVETRTISVHSDAFPPYLVIGVIAFIGMLRTIGEWTMRVFFNVYLDQVLSTPTPLIGSLLAVGQLLGLAALLAPIAIRRWGKEKVIVWASVGMAVAFSPLIFIAHWVAVGAGFIGMIGMMSLSGPAFGVFSQEQVAPRWRTIIAGAISMSFGIGVALIGFGGGYLVEAVGFTSVFVAGAVACALAAMIFWAYFRVRESRSVLLPTIPETEA